MGEVYVKCSAIAMPRISPPKLRAQHVYICPWTHPHLRFHSSGFCNRPWWCARVLLGSLSLVQTSVATLTRYASCDPRTTTHDSRANIFVLPLCISPHQLFIGLAGTTSRYPLGGSVLAPLACEIGMWAVGGDYTRKGSCLQRFSVRMRCLDR